MASAPASSSISKDTISRRAPPVPPKPSLLTTKREDDHKPKQEPSLLKDSDASSLSKDTISRRAPPVPRKPSWITKKREDDHKLKQGPSLLKDSDAVEESLQFTFNCIEEAMRHPKMFELGLQKMLSTVKTHQTMKDQLRDAYTENNTLQKSVEEHQRNHINLEVALQEGLENIKRKNEASTRMKDGMKSSEVDLLQEKGEIKKEMTGHEGKISALEIEEATSLKEYKNTIENLNKKIHALNEVNELQIEKITDLSTELQKRSVELETIQNHNEQVISKRRKKESCDIAITGLETSETELRNIRKEVITNLTDKLRQSSALPLDDKGRAMLQHIRVHLEAEIQTLKSEIEKQKHSQRKAEEFVSSQIEYLGQLIQKQRNQQQIAETFANEGITKLKDEIEDQKRIQTTVEVFADKEMDKLEFQLQEEILKRRFVEKHASVEILKLEDAIEDRKSSLKLAETFAETEISTLETKLERKESTLKLVQRFAEAEITRLEDEVNECLYLKDVLEAEASSLRQELTDLQHKEVAENDHSQTHRTTNEDDKQPQLSTDNGTQADGEIDIKEGEKKMSQAGEKSILLVLHKLEVDLKQKEEELEQVQQSLSTANRKLTDTEKLAASLKQMKEANTLLQMKLDAHKGELDEIERRMLISEGDKLHMDGWLNVSELGWNNHFVFISLRHLTVFKSLQKMQKYEPVIVLDLDSITFVRNFNFDEGWELKNRDRSRMFVLEYEVTGIKKHEPFQDKDMESSENHDYKGHLFQDEQFRTPKDCEACNQPMWHKLKPPPAVACTRCRIKVHKAHTDMDDGSVQQCPRSPIVRQADGSTHNRLQLETESPDMVQARMTHIMEKVRRIQYLCF